MTPKPDQSFGKRQPRLSPDEPPAAASKRSSHVALLLMGTVALGSGAYALMPRENCDPNRPPIAAGQPSDCQQRSSSSGGHGGGSSSRSNFASTDTASSHSSGPSSDAGSSHVARGGFGSFMSHFSGGG
ncbi:MAG: hypothetical protein JWR89_3713 [Tardiphaga sp.]|jgi:hypothetical protein|uniref:hypothetical protein n=1 Tax=Tardiphaga sp. TaxID=1926292 RepID=UPI002610194A|nr:hypothetical protein [Tardiphaga sp.]MDB5503811.1 hypothetical protein [Tardiphaga sp.]